MSYKTFTKEKQSDVDFLKEVGLKPSHKTLDIGCGGGRLGYELINYLNKNNYYGFDKEKNWIEAYEMAVVVNSLSEKNPNILLTDCSKCNIDLKKGVEFDYLYAYSVFTHIKEDLLKKFLNNLKPFFPIRAQMYATILVGDNDYTVGPDHVDRSNEHTFIHYSLDYFNKLLNECGYYLDDIDAKEQLIGPTNASVNGNLIHRMVLIKRKKK